LMDEMGEPRGRISLGFPPKKRSRRFIVSRTLP
jgi:hypothetical protein